MVPEYASSDPKNCPWLYVITYGGGMVEGDRIGLNIDVGKNCSVVVTTQTSTKVRLGQTPKLKLFDIKHRIYLCMSRTLNFENGTGKSI